MGNVDNILHIWYPLNMNRLMQHYFDNIKIKVIMCDHNVCDTIWREDNCRYDYYKLYYYTGGESTLIINQVQYKPVLGDFFLIPAQTVHTYYHNPKNPAVQYWAHIQISLGEYKQIQYDNETVHCHIEKELLTPTFDRLIKSKRENSVLGNLNEKIAVLELLNLFFQRVDVNKLLVQTVSKEAKQIHDYILDNLKRDIRLQELADLIPLQRNYFVIYFKKQFGTTPVEYINAIRLEHGAQLLQDKMNCSIEEIAYEVGYKDYRYFSRLFKKKYGITPSMFRQIKQ